MATYKNFLGEPLEASAVVRRDVFRILDSDGEPMAECVVERRHETLWVNNLWVKSNYRGFRLASELLRAVGAAYSDQPLWLHAQAYEGQPKTDAELVKMYAQFGYKPTAIPGVLCRDYAFLNVQPTA